MRRTTVILSQWEGDLDRPLGDLEKIVQPIEQNLLRIAWNILGNTHDAEDALQETMSIVVKRWHRVAAHPAPSALVVKICTECALDLLRKRVRYQAKANRHALERMNESVVPTDRAALSSEVKQTVLNAITTLPRNQAIAFTLRVVEEQDYEQIAATLGCGEATARTHVKRARQKLATLLQHLKPNGENEDDSKND